MVEIFVSTVRLPILQYPLEEKDDAHLLAKLR